MLSHKQYISTRGREYIHVLRDDELIGTVSPEYFSKELLYAFETDNVTSGKSEGIEVGVTIKVNRRFVLSLNHCTGSLNAICNYASCIRYNPLSWREKIAEYYGNPPCDDAAPFVELAEGMEQDESDPHVEVLH